ncbi:MAG: hypothetical protein R3A46_00100 [Thermomicrobiales bacterium]
MSVHVIHGRNAVDIEDRVAELLSSDDPQGLNTSTLSIESADISDVRAAVTTPGFFGAARMVLIQGIPGIDKSPRIEWDDLADCLRQQQPTTTTVLATYQKIPANRRILKAAKQEGWEVELHDLIFGPPLVQWVESRAGTFGAAIDQRASRELLDRLFPTAWQREDRWNPQSINMRQLATEIEKLAAGSANGTITQEMVAHLVADRSGVTAFKLNDETFEGKTAAALKELDNVLANGDAPERVVGQIGYQPLVLHAAGYVQRYGPDAVAEAAGVSSGQLKATVGRKSAWRNRPGLSRAIESLRHGEWLVKTGRARGTDAVLVPLVAEIAEGFDS